MGPGLPTVGCAPEQLIKEMGRIDEGVLGVKGPHGFAQMHRGWLMVVVGGQGFGFVDVSNPQSPKLAHFQRHDQVAEGRGYGFSHGPDGDTLALMATDGLMMWNVTDVHNPTLLSHLRFPHAETVPPQGHAIAANWWTFYQAPFVYCAGTGHGLFVIDATDPRKPALAHHEPITQTGGFRVGSTFAIGNLLVLSGNDVPGLATLDISDPKRPRLLQALTRNLPAEKSSMVNGNRIYQGSSRGTVYDITDPAQIKFLTKAGPSGYPQEGGGFVTVQDGFMHVGASSHYVKIDARDPSARSRLVGWDNFTDTDRDLDFASVIGPLVIVSDADGRGSFILPHQAEPDTKGPEVNMVVPKDGATGQALTTRLGLTFTDAIDLGTVNESTLIVRPAGGRPLPGRYSHQTGIVNFSPDEPLAPETTYEIVVPAGGIKDDAGNGTEKSFTNRFTTGSHAGAIALLLAAAPPRPVSQPVTFNVAATSAGARLKFSWDFGDATAPTSFALQPEATHTYVKPGHYSIKVTATDGEFRATRSFTQTIYLPPTTMRPTASSTLILDEPRDRVWAVNPDADTVTAIDATALVKLFEVPVGGHPRTLALAPDTTLWVVNQDDATISVLDSDDGAMLQTIALPRASRPYGIAFSGDGAAAYVTLQGTGRLLKLDPIDGEILATIDVGPNPRGLAITGDSERILVTRFLSSQDHARVIEVSAAQLNVVRKHRLGLDLGPDTETTGRGVPNYLSSITITPDGRRAWVPSKKDNTGRGLLRDGRPLTFDHTVRTIVSQIDLGSNDEILRNRLDLAERDMADAVCFSERGDFAFVAIQGNNCVAVLDAYTGQLIQELDSAGAAPQGLVLSADGQRLFIQNFLGRSVSVYDASGIVNATDYSANQLKVLSTVAHENLPARVLKGKQIFYNASDPHMSRHGYLSCASCHLDGEQDGRIWDFTDRGEGLRNTVTLLGRRGTAQGK
ncbi:MAG TPA: Ig-like domain-containing protein, partial [Verrucomicrobiae bacterium]